MGWAERCVDSVAAGGWGMRCDGMKSGAGGCSENWIAWDSLRAVKSRIRGMRGHKVARTANVSWFRVGRFEMAAWAASVQGVGAVRLEVTFGFNQRVRSMAAAGRLSPETACLMAADRASAAAAWFGMLIQAAAEERRMAAGQCQRHGQSEPAASSAASSAAISRAAARRAGGQAPHAAPRRAAVAGAGQAG